MSAVNHVVKFFASYFVLHNLSYSGGNLCKTDFLALIEAKRHVPTCYENSRDIQSCCRHKLAGNDRVTSSQKHHTVEHICLNVKFNFVCYKVTARKFNVSWVLQNHTVTNTGCGKLKRQPPCLTHTVFDSLCNFFQVHMSRVVFVPGINNSDVGLFNFFFCVSHTVKNTVTFYTSNAEFPFTSFEHNITFFL